MAPILPTTQTALIAGPDGDFLLSHDAPVAPLEPDSILIRTAAIALNPVDAKMAGDFLSPGSIFGFDCSGTVLAVGSAVKKNLKPGDRVCGSADGMSKARPYGGAFAEYVSLPGDLALKIPDGMSFESAAALGTALASAGMALFYSLGIPGELLDKPSEKPYPVLVYGGASATGTMALQLLKICGLKPITTCSPSSFPFVQSYGATAAFDYRSPTCAADIKDYTRNTLSHAFDCITQPATMKICFAALGRGGGRYTALDPYPEEQNTRKAVKTDWVLATKITGRGSDWPAPYQCVGDEKLKAFAGPLFARIQRLLSEGKIRAHPQRVMGGGLGGVVDGLQMIRKGEVRGEKLIYTL